MVTIKILVALTKMFGLLSVFLGILTNLESWKATLLFCLGSVSCLFYLVMQLQKILKNQQEIKRGNIELKRELEELKRFQSDNANY